MVKPYYIYGCSVYYIYGQILLHLWLVDLLHLWLKVITFMVSITFMVNYHFISSGSAVGVFADFGFSPDVDDFDLRFLRCCLAVIGSCFNIGYDGV